MSQQKYMIKGEFTLDEINAIKKSLEFFSQSNSLYEDVESYDEEQKNKQKNIKMKMKS